MDTILNSFAELKAQEAQEFPAFSRVNLRGIKTGVANLLSLIGREGIFDEYTIHNISHIDKMISSLDWLIPQETKDSMSPADWLMTILAIYFHDLGMLVTKREYQARSQSGFQDFVEKELFSGTTGEDYRAKIQRLAPDAAERFLYQEYVRSRHAERIRAWIMGETTASLGIAHAAVAAIDDLLYPLTPQFRRDLAFVCESHHLEDLYNLRKYKVSQPYGDSDLETVNLQYSAVLLRTSDLLHVTSDRTPSLVFKTINPSDPLSQQEWAKQMAVTRVRPKITRDKEGNLNEELPKDTIEIHAYFKDDRGFFGLTSYLTYVEEQLKKSAEWIRSSEKFGATKYKFPWRFIDDSNIETEGFLRETFEFTLDQAKILDLLTGHTLYNDSGVVLREIAQNAIDAVRLKRLELVEQGEFNYKGKVRIGWDEPNSMLTVCDNGTGMTQTVIEKHLLKVGSSRYQDPEFKKSHPRFSPISRFGIGILSAFMIADEVEIITCSPDEDEARHLSLRSVHGKYLIRLLAKDSKLAELGILPHGTVVKLRLRPSATITDIASLARQWVVIPECCVTVEDGTREVPIGFEKPSDAVREICRNLGIEDEVRVRERASDGVTLAYATRWSDYFKEEQFEVISREMRDRLRSRRDFPSFGICVGGIRVNNFSPGFEDQTIIALANATGPSAPKTNVARSNLENTAERHALLQTLYSLYCKHVEQQIRELHETHHFSLTWAVQESNYLVGPLLSLSKALDRELLLEVIKRFPLLLVEKSGRSALAPMDLQAAEAFWTIKCKFFDSAEWLIREIPADTSLADLAAAVKFRDLKLPDEPVLCGDPDDILAGMALRGREVGEIRIDRALRRVDLKWVLESAPPRWHTIKYRVRRLGPRRAIDLFRIGRTAIPIAGLSNETVVVVSGVAYLIASSEPARAVCTFLEPELSSESTQSEGGVLDLAFEVLSHWLKVGDIKDADALVRESIEQIHSRVAYASRGAEVLRRFANALGGSKPLTFSPSAWQRDEEE